MYTVKFYVNDLLTATVPKLDENAAYRTAVPPEAHQAGNRWHLMMRQHAGIQMRALLVGETVRIAWQDPAEGFDTEHILIIRENDDMWVNAPAPPPVPNLRRVNGPEPPFVQNNLNRNNNERQRIHNEAMAAHAAQANYMNELYRARF